VPLLLGSWPARRRETPRPPAPPRARLRSSAFGDDRRRAELRREPGRAVRYRRLVPSAGFGIAASLTRAWPFGAPALNLPRPRPAGRPPHPIHLCSSTPMPMVRLIPVHSSSPILRPSSKSCQGAVVFLFLLPSPWPLTTSPSKGADKPWSRSESRCSRSLTASLPEWVPPARNRGSCCRSVFPVAAMTGIVRPAIGLRARRPCEFSRRFFLSASWNRPSLLMTSWSATFDTTAGPCSPNLCSSSPAGVRR